MVMYTIQFHKQAINDISYLKANKLDFRAKKIIELLRQNPYQTPPHFEKMVGCLKEIYTRPLNIEQRIIYIVEEDRKNIKILSMWKHY